MNMRTGTPRLIKGPMLQRALHEFGDPKERMQLTAEAFLRKFQAVLKLKDPDQDLKLYRTDRDELDRTHLRYAQMHQGLRVWPAEVLIHLNPEGDVDLMSGGYVPMPNKLILNPIVLPEQAQALAKEAVHEGNGGTVSEPELIIYAPTQRAPRLGWKMDVNVSLVSAWTVIIDAINGATLEVITLVQESNVAGSGVDKLGITRPLNVWSEDGFFFMIDTSKPMFDPRSDPPAINTTNGGIFILDVRSQDENNEGGYDNGIFRYLSDSPTSGWVPDGVSASFALSQTYDYYLQRHNWNSYDNQGSNMTALTRVGSNPPRNAFWLPGQRIMVFNTGPMVGALDITAHELTHAVTNLTADLVYMNQSGALNEAFSDIFGELVEARVKGGAPDWMTHTGLAPPRRSLKDPSSEQIGQTGRPYPSKMSEFIAPDDPFLDNFQGRDQGGVHFNSSIINHAFYLLAEGLPGAVGLSDAERIFFRTLTVHLSKGSEFIDARNLAIQSAEEIFGANSIQAQITAEAFDTVEIFSATPTPTPSPTPFPEVSGPDATIFTFVNPQNGAPTLGRREEALGDTPGGNFLSLRPLALSRPTVSGDGTIVGFITAQK